MPEEGKHNVKTDSKFVEEIYTDSGVVGKFWRKETLETFILKGCDDERVILLMGSDCRPEELMMDDETLSDWNSEGLFNIDTVKKTVIISEKQNDGKEESGDKSEFSQGTSKEAEMTNQMQSQVIADNTSYHSEQHDFHDQVNEDMISYNNQLYDNEFDKEFQESIGISQHFSGILPYSGSISLRSTSSNASTQSFAFPTLAQEWNSSPERMPKPDTKPKQWKMKLGWACCKF